MTNLLAALLAVLLLPGCLPATAGGGLVPFVPDPSLLVTVGDVTDSTAVLWLRGQSPGTVHVRYGAVGRREETVAQVLVNPAADLTGKVLLSPLTPSTRYRYLVEQGAGKAEGEFVTAPPVGQEVPVRFLWSGDLGSQAHCRHVSNGYPIFRTLARFA